MRALNLPELRAYASLCPTARLYSVRVQRVVWLPGADAMALGTLILVVNDMRVPSKLMAHEIAHVRQWGEMGVWLFLRRYLGDYFRGLAMWGSHGAAYAGIRAEVDARMAASEWERENGKMFDA